MIPTIEWKDGRLRLLDQSRLPGEVVFLDCEDYQTVAQAIRELKVRGAPAIEVAADLGIALGARSVTPSSPDEFSLAVHAICDHLRATRPTAVNLFWAIERMERCLKTTQGLGVDASQECLLQEALRLLAEDLALNQALGRHGASLIEHGHTVLTHCNAGALATAGYGTALGVIRAAWEQGKQVHVVADGKRPVLQGA